MNTTLTGFLGLLAIVGGIAYVTGQFGNGKAKKISDAVEIAKKTTELLKAQNETLEAQLNAARADIIQLGKDLAHMQGEMKQKDEHHRQELAAKDSEIERYITIFQGRSPEQEVLLKELNTTMGELKILMQAVSKHLVQVAV